MVTTNVSYVEEEKEYEIILHGVEVRISERVLVGIFGAMIINDDATQRYHLVE